MHISYLYTNKLPKDNFFSGKSFTDFGRLQYAHFVDTTSDERKKIFLKDSNIPSVGGPLRSSHCPIHDFCLNGGTCQYFSAIGEQICQ